MAFPIPKGLSKEDEGRHAVPQGAEGRLFSDTLWVSVVDPKANIFGVNHIHLTAKGYARFQAVFFIDGTLQAYGNKVPLDPEPDAGPFTDGNMTYEVIHIRSTHNHGVLKLWKRAENDVENRLDCYEAFVDWEIEETGETGTGVAEYSVWPVWPQWQL
jgi:hypothetical protein